MSHPPPYVFYRRRFGLFRRFWWFAIGAGAASLWIRHHERDAAPHPNPNERRRFCSYLWRRDLPPQEQHHQQQTPPPYAYDWAAHRPGLKTSMPDAAAVPHTSPVPPAPPASHAPAPPVALEVPAAPAPPVPAPQAIPNTFPPPAATTEEDRRRRDRDREELERRAREYAADKLERLSAALDRLREGLRADIRPPQQEKEEPRWV